MGILSKLLNIVVNNQVQNKISQIQQSVDSDELDKSLEKLKTVYSQTEKSLEWYCKQYPEHSICKDKKLGV